MADDKTYTQADIDKAIASATAKVQESIDKLEAKNEELVGELRTTKSELRKSKDIDPADLTKLEEENEKLRGDLAKATKDAKDAITRAEKAEKAVESESTYTQRLLIDNGLNSALAEAGVKEPALLKAAKALLGSGLQVTTEGDQRVVKAGDKALGDFVKEWSGTDDAKHFITAAANSGGGAPGGKSGGSGKTMTERDFNALAPKDRSAFMADGGQIADQAA